DRPNPRVGMWAAQDLADQHARRRKVGAEFGSAGHLVQTIGPNRTRAYDLEGITLGNRLYIERHQRPSRISAAALTTARTILSYPVQRHRFPASQYRTSFSVGFGLRSRSAFEATRKPGVHTPHCKAACSRNFTWSG